MSNMTIYASKYKQRQNQEIVKSMNIGFQNDIHQIIETNAQCYRKIKWSIEINQGHFEIMSKLYRKIICGKIYVRKKGNYEE